MPAAKKPKLTRPSPIRGGHNVAKFDCGEPVMNLWLEKHALVSSQMRTANTFVVCRGRRVIGYYSLANAAVAHSETSAKVRRNTPEPIPATLLARLAVDKSEQGQNLGRNLLMDACRRVLLGAKHTAARLLLVHPLNERAVNFYRRYNFRHLKSDGSSVMYIALDTLADGL
jgi:ribosomal protein S18 acetylase RimI-like enzyme